MIKLEKVSKYYASGDNNVSLGLHNVSLELKKGEIVGIVGESGSGKSTFLNVCSLLDTYEDGEIYYDGVPVSSFSPEEIDEFRKNHIGFIFQNYNLIDSYTVLQNVLMPLVIKGVNPKEAKEKAKELIKKVGLEHRMHHKGTKLSGGEKQRCVIARALASDSEILACDEPTGNLDSNTGREIIELIKDVANDKLVLIVTHNYDELKDIITRRLTFADGNLIEDVNLKEKDECTDILKPNSEYKFNFIERLKLSIKDFFSTPRKSLLTFLIYLVISVFIAYLYTAVLTFKNSYSEEGLFYNVAKDRYVIFEDGKKFDLADFEGYDINEHARYEDERYMFVTTNLDSEYFCVRYSMPNVKLKKGTLPKNDNEVIIGIPENAMSSYYGETITIDLRFGSRHENKYIKYDEFYNYDGVSYSPVKYKVVGYYNISDTSFRDYLITGTEAFNQKIINTSLKRTSVIVNYVSMSYKGSSIFNIELDESVANNTINVTIPERYEGIYSDITKYLDIKFRYNSDCIDTNLTYNIKYEGESFFAYANMDSLVSIVEAGQKDYLSIYETDQLKIDNMFNDIKNKGYGICNAKEAYIAEDISVSSILNTILYAFFIVGVIFAFVVIFFISYFILARIYSIKNKDYTVFRTLGMSKKDMASLVRIQTVLVSLATAILVLIIVGITYILNHPIISGFHRIGIIGIIVYILFIAIYSLFFAIRFNRKLYKFSVSKTFRGGVLGND